MGKTKIFVATPMYGGACCGGYTLSMMRLIVELPLHGIDVGYGWIQNESLIMRARNTLAHEFLKASECTHLMWIDADISFRADDIVRMVRANKNIICGIYPKKNIRWDNVAKAAREGVDEALLKYYTGDFVVNLKGGAAETVAKVDEACEIDNGGTGFMLVRREVFETLADRVPWYIDKGRSLEKVPVFFDTSVDEKNELLSEDYHFCTIARAAGYRVWAAPWVVCTHTGTYDFVGRMKPA